MLDNFENYGFYQELVKSGYQTIRTEELTNENIDTHFDNIIAILSDGIENPEVQHFKIHVIFPDDEIDLHIIHYMYNLMFWTLTVASNNTIMSYHLFFEEVITAKNIKYYIDNLFIRKNIDVMDLKLINQTIDRCVGKFRYLENFQMYCMNTLDFKDTIDMMNKYPEFNDAIHLNIDGVPMEDIKEVGMKSTNTMIKYITRNDEDHNSKYPFKSKEGINAKQFKEVCANIGTKPNGQGGVFPHPINNSFINGGLQSVEDIIMDSSMGRIAQILTKQNVGQSGAFARRLGLNNQSTRLHEDPEYICNTKNYEMVNIKNQDILDIYDMRWYKDAEGAPERIIDSVKDKHLIGKTLYVRSPMTCASAARGEGICYRCYGKLAYANRNINIGQIAAELLSSIYTQTLLSAKHLLESAIIKMDWCKEFHELFSVEFDQILLKDDVDYRKLKLVILEDEITEDDDDEENDIIETQDCTYVYSFIVRRGQDDILIKTSESDPIYIHQDLLEIINRTEVNENGEYEIEMSALTEKGMFTIDIQNDELSKVMKEVKNLIDNKSYIKLHDRNSILEAFVDANLKGHIKINAVHFEVLLMNQIRAADDLLNTPDWTNRNEPYKLITLENALTDNMSVSIRLQASKLKRTLIHPSNRKIYKGSNMDLFMMTHPQEFMNSEFESGNSNERKIIKPFYKI